MKKENINDMAIKYMEQKYGETFEYYAPYGRCIPNTHELIVTGTNYPGEQIYIEIENYNSEDRIYSDNYLAIKYKEKTREFFTECVGRCFDEFKILYSPSHGTQSPTLSADASFEDYLKDRVVCIVVFVIVKESSFKNEEQAETLGELVSKSGTRFTLHLFVIPDEDYTGEWESYKEFYSKEYPLVKQVRISNSNSDSELKLRWIKE